MNGVLRLLVQVLKTAATLIWRVVGPVLIALVQIVAALLVLFEEWGWRPLSDALARARAIPALGAAGTGDCQLTAVCRARRDRAAVVVAVSR